MKELSIEEKAKRYDEAKLRMSRAFNSNRCSIDFMNEIFPELKESEDERIRKALRERIIRYDPNNEILIKECGISQKQFLAWLEKQGEQKPGIIPKFRVGDWIVNNEYGHVIKVLDINKEQYTYRLDYGDTCGTIIISLIDNDYHPWTIQDAKAGDVLEFGDHGRLVVGIVSYVNKTTGKVDVNCLLENNNFKMGNYYNLDTIKPRPATKEQHDLLFQKMKEAGYEWDAERKELKKIEQKPIEWNEKIKGLDELETYVLSLVPDRPLDAVKVDSKNIRFLINKEQKPWSEEDEKMLNKLLAVVNLYYGYSGNVLDKQSCTSFLKSLKDRYTWKPSDE